MELKQIVCLFVALLLVTPCYAAADAILPFDKVDHVTTPDDSAVQKESGSEIALTIDATAYYSKFQ